MTSRSGQDFPREPGIFHSTYFTSSYIPMKAFVFVVGPSVERPFSGSEKEIYGFKHILPKLLLPPI